MEDCGTFAASFLGHFPSWPEVDKHSPEAAFGTRGKMGTRRLKAEVKQNVFRTTSSVRLSLGLPKKVTALCSFCHPFPGSATPTMDCPKGHEGYINVTQLTSSLQKGRITKNIFAGGMVLVPLLGHAL